MSDNESDEGEGGFTSYDHSSDESSCGYDGVEWMEHIDTDGSLLYIESYVSSTVREKQTLALRTSREKKLAPDKVEKVDTKMGKLKKENKLLGLLRRRPSIRGRGPTSLSLVPSGAGNTEDGTAEGSKHKDNKPRESSPAPKVTFRDNKSGETRTVALHVVSVGDGRGGLCEAVLGVVVGRFSEPPAGRIMVAGILPGSEAHTTHSIKIGDWLKEINRREVTWDNIDAVLGEIRVPSVVTLCLQKCASETLSDPDHASGKRITQTGLVKHVTGQSVRDLPAPVVGTPGPHDLVRGAPPHVALLLTLAGVTDQSPEGADIKYQFPRGSSRLVRVRGVFLTLAHTARDMTQQQHACSTTVQMGGDEIVHVAYRKEGDLVWVMALPQTYCSEHELIHLSQLVTDNLLFEFGSLAKCLQSPRYPWHLDHLLGKVFSSCMQTYRHPLPLTPALPTHHYLHLNNVLLYPPHLHQEPGVSWSVLSGAPWLVLQDGGGGAKTEVDNCLSELEAGDFGEDGHDDADCGHLAPNIEGCCLFYKGVLVTSHLPPALLRLVYTQARLHGLLSLTACEAVSQMVAWRTCHLPDANGAFNITDNLNDGNSDQFTTNANQSDETITADAGIPADNGKNSSINTANQALDSNHHTTTTTDQSSSSKLPGGNTAHLLMVGMNHMLIAMILDDYQPIKARRGGGPDPLLVDQVEATLFHLHSLHIPALCQDSLTRGGPEVVCADQRFETGDGQPTTDLPATPPPSPTPDVPSILKQRTAPEPVQAGTDDDQLLYCHPPPAQLVGEEDEEEDDEEDEGGGANEGGAWRLWRGHAPSPSLRGSDSAPDPTPLHRLPVSPIRVTTGGSPVLFHLVHLDVGEGVLVESLPPMRGKVDVTIPPTTPPTTPPISPLHQAVLDNFRRASVRIHKLLHSSLFNQLGCPDGPREHGELFSCSPPSTGKRRQPPGTYWVVGRVVPATGREVYVCYHESVPQNLHEMATRLCLGTTL